ncbi:MAG: tetratricopeptide repeat protein [Pseudomonadota bacterium]
MSIIPYRPPAGHYRLLLPVAAALLTGACAQSGLETGSLALSSPPAEETTAAAPPTRAVAAAAEIDALDRAASKPEAASAIAESRKLREDGHKLQAMKRLDDAAEKFPADKALLKERGLLALDVGQIGKAVKLLEKAHDPKKPDWRVLSGLGAALSAAGKQAEAQARFAKALELAPDHPSILNNLALSYALDGKHAEAERLLRRAAASQGPASISRQNLALLVGLNGNVDEARKVSEAALPANVARANVSYLERLRSGKQISRVEPTAPASIQAAEAPAGGN